MKGQHRRRNPISNEVMTQSKRVHIGTPQRLNTAKWKKNPIEDEKRIYHQPPPCIECTPTLVVFDRLI